MKQLWKDIIIIGALLACLIAWASYLPAADKESRVALQQQFVQARNNKVILEDRVKWLQALLYEEQKSLEAWSMKEKSISDKISKIKADKKGAPEPAVATTSGISK